ncbi:MAG TPA: hypothetical protein PKO15_00955 [Fibrobacteria bacterium]|nr:hypothetical protein [Fibrobacteria bacterium]HOX50601.1 hypothetical protein [Fibrobacteria bacterium]
MKRLLALCALLLASCGNVHTGGFETTDLHARVVRMDGSPVVAARAWLVRSLGTEAPAAIVDSGYTDSLGEVRFALPASGVAGLGLDASLADSLGMSPRSLESARFATVVLKPAFQISHPKDSSGTASLFVPGSHFVSGPSTTGAKVELRLPAGTWDLAIRKGSSVDLVGIALASDTTLGSVAPTPADSYKVASVRVLAGRTQIGGLDGLQLNFINDAPISLDSLTLRLFLQGTGAEMADFGARLDMAQLYDSIGFTQPAGLDGSSWKSLRPVSMGGACSASVACTWFFDLPVEGVSLESGGRLEFIVLFESQSTTGSRPLHDPFTGNDWSFRARKWADSTANPRGLPDYGAIPMASTQDLPPEAPFIAIVRRGVVIAGAAP